MSSNFVIYYLNEKHIYIKLLSYKYERRKMRIILFADLHIYLHFGMKQFEDIASGFLINLLKYCRENEIQKIIFLGDFFHIKNKISVLPFVKAIDILRDFMKNGIELTFLIGNHDCPQMDTTDYSIIHTFKEFGKVIPLFVS